jgi:hypothetical protein
VPSPRVAAGQQIDDLVGDLRAAKGGGYEWVSTPFFRDLTSRKPVAAGKGRIASFPERSRHRRLTPSPAWASHIGAVTERVILRAWRLHVMRANKGRRPAR